MYPRAHASSPNPSSSPTRALLVLLPLLLLAPACEERPITGTGDAATAVQAATEADTAPSPEQAVIDGVGQQSGTGSSLAERPERPRDFRARSRLGNQRRRLDGPGGIVLDRHRAARERRGDNPLSHEQNAALAVLREHRPALERCYLAALEDNPGLEGGVTLRIDINPDGRAATVEPLVDDMGDTDVASCLVDQVQHIGFPETDEGVHLLHPMRFGPSQAAPTR